MRSRSVLILAVVVAFSWGILAWIAARALMVRKELGHADSIVVLAGSAAYRERVRHAAQLVKQGRASLVILTNDNHRAGWSNKKQETPLFVDLASEELQHLGVASDEIEVISPAVYGTHDEATLIREYAQRHQLKSVLIVTSAYHSRRALWTFEHVFAGTGIVVGMDAAPPGEQTPFPATWWLHLRGWQMVPIEYVKMIYYRLRF